MPVATEPARPGGKFTPPIKESLQGGKDRVLPLPRRPDPEERIEGEKQRFAFEDDLPPEEDFQEYDEYVIYWEPFDPGIEVQHWARVQPIASSNKGQWVCRNKVEEDAVRARLAPLTGGDPDKLKLTADDKKRMHDPEQRTDCTTCQFQTTSNVAWNIHKAKWQHQ